MPQFQNLERMISEVLKKQTGSHVYLLRHTQSMANHAGSVVGWTDSRLSIKGREQANKLFRSFHKHIPAFTSFHSSDLSRCKDTIQLGLGFPSFPIKQSKQIRELHFGDHEGIHFDSLPEEQKNIINTIDYQAPNGENWPQARKRALKYLSSLGKGHHLVATHGGLICSLTYELGIKHVVPNGSLNQKVVKINMLWEFPKDYL